MPPRVPLADDALRALPYALVLAILLGGVVVAGANYSNAFPSEARPFGWKGPSSFENAVAMVRGDLVLAAGLPALVLGARALARRTPAQDAPASLVAIYLTHGAMLALAVAAAAGIGAWGASKAPFAAVLAFWVAHSVLALSFYSIAFAWNCVLREHATAAAVATWIVFVGLYESVTRTILFRTEGYTALASGAFPNWFWVAQGLSPLSSYTGIMILWRPRFRDYMEKAALENATLPSWLLPGTFVALAVLLWMLVPLALGMFAWRRRRNRKPSFVPARRGVGTADPP